MKPLLRSLIPSILHPGDLADRELKKLIAKKEVASGPFKGMKYVDRAFGSAFYPKLVGSYELELHPWIAKISEEDFELIVDIGAAEGYYAIGLAKLFANVPIIAFEAEENARELLHKMAELNNVANRLSIRGTCLSEDIDSLPKCRSLIVMDAEGAEIELLNTTSQAFIASTILFESHHTREKIASEILTRFRNTHTSAIVTSRKRSSYDIKHLSMITRWWIKHVCSSWTEERDCLQDWYLLRPNAKNLSESKKR